MSLNRTAEEECRRPPLKVEEVGLGLLMESPPRHARRGERSGSFRAEAVGALTISLRHSRLCARVIAGVTLSSSSEMVFKRRRIETWRRM
jgi:hypothetical protein